MRDSLTALPPTEIIQAFTESSGTNRLPHMFEILGDRTADRLAAGSLALARLWSSAWAEGNGVEVPDDSLDEIDPDHLTMYEEPTFAQSFRLDDPAFPATLT